ncbi:MAG: S-methyl-5-thioribose-1-phosphate isomerase, partial [Syntrophomonadaceae bacterium]|nr:S-methyl-5-thioribose-1-phosphate isomerase [Syntrophomonadaceae bacterium]
MVETLYADEQGLWLLDQRQLPHLVEYRCCRTAVEVATAIRDMVVRGAPAIGVAAAFALALEARECGLPVAGLRAHLEDTACMLAATRPTAVNLFWALQRMRGVWEGEAQGGDLRQRLWREAEAMKAEDIAANRSIGRHGAALLSAGSRVLTICNAGSLATCGYGTALGVVRWAWAEGRLQRVYACETRPVLQGARLTVWELQQDGIPVTLITDGAAGYLMQRGMVDAVVVGADRVAANGDTANKIGTYGLA